MKGMEMDNAMREKMSRNECALHATQALVERYTSVEVEGLTVDGRPLKLQASGWQARILQHEVDHLRGTLYVDRMLTRSFSMRGNSGRLPEDVPRPGPCTCCHAIDSTART
ncbi:hypothetical protein ABPG75_004775 [Micractinium tetrahymenae]